MNENEDEGIDTEQVHNFDSMYDNSSDDAFRPDSNESDYDSSDDNDNDRISQIVHRRKEINEQLKLLKEKSKSYHFFMCKIYSKSKIS